GQATIKKYGFSLLKSGTISGIPAILLNEANLLNFEVIVLVIRVIRELPDFRAAATISDAITKIVPGVYCDIGTLMVEAKMIEEDIKKIRENQKATLRGGIYS
ncbi:MAG: PAC2 family protein, partial [Nitrososphaeraceae archaeon]